MSGQGSPKFVFPTCTVRQLAVLAFVAAQSLSCLQGTASVNAQDFYPLGPTSAVTRTATSPVNGSSVRRLRLRLSWGGGTPQTWTGNIDVREGAFSDVAPLGLNPDANAAVTQVGEDLVVRHWSPTNYGGADVTLTGTAATQVRFEVGSIEQPETRFEQTMSFEELAAGTIGGELDLLGNRCSVSRAPGDELEVSFQREHLVFKPGESFTFSITPNSTPLAGRTASCRVKLVPAHATGITGNRPLVTRPLVSQALVFQMDENGTAESQELSLNIPDEEAVYNIEIELDAGRYQASFSPRKNTIRRSIQLIVLADQATRFGGQAWRQVSSVNAVDVSSESFRAWSQFSRIAGWPTKDMLGNELRSPVVVEEQTMMQLLPGGWQAIPLTIDRIGMPHIIELEYVADGETAIGISLLQPDASGQIPSYGFDSGVFVPRSLVSPSKGDGSRIQRHRLTVWPETKTPYLLVANRHATASATFGSVNVLAGPDRLDPGEIESGSSRDTRKLMAFYETPQFPESFGATESIDSMVGQPLDDWRMFYEGASRFIDYLKANSYRGAFITVACDGSAIYPSQLLLPSPKHDNGTFFSSGQDPVRKDVLEMLFRMFEREGLVLVPTLALSSPLPEVEVLRRRDGLNPDFESIEVDATNRSTAMDDRLPIYNPLNLTVQHAASRVVEELAERYRTFRTFEGVAIICRPDTFTLLPGRQCGNDTLTVQRFFQSQPDLGELPNQWSEVQDILAGSHQQQWIQWRAAQMTLWYQELATRVQRALPNGRLFLAPIDLYRGQETASALSPSLHSSTDFERVMLHLGFEAKLVRSIPESNPASGSGDIVFLNPHRIAPDQALSSQRVELAVESSRQAQAFFADADYAGDLYTHRVSWAHFAQLQAQSPFGIQRSPLMRLQQMSPAASFNRKRFVQSIKDRDARMLVDGGGMITMGQEASIAEMMRVFGQLPDARFTDVISGENPDVNATPLAVRQLQYGDDTYFYVANASPWPTRVTLFLNSQSAETPVIESLSGPQQQLIAGPLTKTATSPRMLSVSYPKPSGNSFEVNAQVPAYGLLGGRMSKEHRLFDFGFGLPADADEDLRRHVFALQAKLTKSGNPGPVTVLENSGFEFNGQPTLGGWETGHQSTGKVRLDLNQDGSESRPPMGRASLRMENKDPDPVWVRSNVFEAGNTGRLSISVWLKTNDTAQQPPLRLALEGQSGGTNYYRFGSVGSLSPDSRSNQIESRWKRFAVHFDDLPLEGLSNVRIGFDLMGPGQVNIDNVQVFDRWFDENDAKTITQMLASTGPLLSNPATFDNCRRLLDGYWLRFLDQFIEIEESTDDVRDNEARATESESVPGKTGQDSTASRSESANASLELRNDNSHNQGSETAPMFRRFRNLVPQRKQTLR